MKTDYICADCGGDATAFNRADNELTAWVCQGDGCGNTQCVGYQDERPYWVVERGHLLVDFTGPDDTLLCRVPVSKELVRIADLCGMYFKNAVGLGGVTIRRASDAEPQLRELLGLLSEHRPMLVRVSRRHKYSVYRLEEKVEMLSLLTWEFPDARIGTSWI